VDVRRAYCSAVDRNVPVRLRAGASRKARLTVEDPADLVCLDYKVRCTGWCCPLFSINDETADAVMAETSAVPAAAAATVQHRPPRAVRPAPRPRHR
jgi:hypothetical protein